MPNFIEEMLVSLLLVPVVAALVDVRFASVAVNWELLAFICVTIFAALKLLGPRRDASQAESVAITVLGGLAGLFVALELLLGYRPFAPSPTNTSSGYINNNTSDPHHAAPVLLIGLWTNLRVWTLTLALLFCLTKVATSAWRWQSNGGAATDPSKNHSLADQKARFARAVAENNTRYLHIEQVYSGAYLKGKTVLVTGGGTGLGLALVRQLVADGAVVFVTVRKPTNELASVSGVHRVLPNVDVTDMHSIERMVATLRGVRFDFVINNAGYFFEQKETVPSMNFAEELKQIDICALGPLRISTALLTAKMVRGAIVIITSQAGSTEWRFTQNPAGGDYGHHMSRAACNIAGVLLAQELKAQDIPVLLLHPGFNRTAMTAKYAAIWDEEGAVEASVGAMRVLHEMRQVAGSADEPGAAMAHTAAFVNCEDGLRIPW